MYALVDYITATIILGDSHFPGRNLFRRHIFGTLWNTFGKEVYTTLFPTVFPDGPTFPPYKVGWQSGETKASVMAHPELNHALIQLSGQACKHLTENGHLQTVLRLVQDRVTRIDVAADIPTDLDPTDFCLAGYSARFSYNSVTASAQGKSVYIGSPSSARRAVVYRYDPPHPRNRLLRVEHRLRGDYAKDICRTIIEDGVTTALAALGGTFGWTHNVWELDALKMAPLPSTGVSADSGSEVRWVLTQVIPALRRYEREGKIDDLRAFIETHLFDESYTSQHGA